MLSMLFKTISHFDLAKRCSPHGLTKCSFNSGTEVFGSLVDGEGLRFLIYFGRISKPLVRTSYVWFVFLFVFKSQIRMAQSQVDKTSIRLSKDRLTQRR